MVDNNNDFLRWDVKPVWIVSFKSEVAGTEVGEYSFEVLGLNRSAGDINRNWEKIHSVEQFNQGRAAKPGDFTITLAVKENGNAYEAMRRLSKGAIEFDVRCDLISENAGINQASPSENNAGKKVWMKGFEKFIGCVVSRESQTIEIATIPVREFECEALRHEIMGYNTTEMTLKALIEGDGVFPSVDALEDAKKFSESTISE